MSKDVLCLHLAVDEMFSISGYDLENERMPCKEIYCNKYRKFVINKFVILKIISLTGNIFYFTFTLLYGKEITLAHYSL